MDKPPRELRGQRFDRSWHPYTHQLDAWRILKQPDNRSVVVSAGTGAGKTECFLVPILDDLARRAAERRAALQGVEALFLYPLNALINSQRERLSAWTRGFDGQVRYALYNGETPNSAPIGKQRATPEQLLSRKAIRATPPSLLITNATMLEYLLVRPDDAPILEQSRGRLRYIVIDEAHTYVGSMAAELALLLRRVMNAFEVDPAHVRFIATSATLASGDDVDASADIRRFLADVAGQDEDTVAVITDTRAIPGLPPLTAPLETLPDTPNDPSSRFGQLTQHPPARAIRDALVERPRTAAQLRELLASDRIDLNEQQIVGLLDLCKYARASDAEEPFLPLRGHIFARSLPGLWACLNPGCPGRAGHLAHPAWPFGAVYASRHLECTHLECGGQVLELCLCQQCGHELLVASIAGDTEDSVSHLPFDQLEDPAAEEEDPGTGDDEVDEPDDEPTNAAVLGSCLISRAIPTRQPTGALEPVVHLDPRSGVVGTAGKPFAMSHPVGGKFECPRCGKTDRSDRMFLRPCRTGRTFLMGVSVPTLLEAMEPESAVNDLPMGGRRTISFTDSRQGTARFAARSQGEAERNYVRSFIYHQVLAKQGATPEALQHLQDELAKRLKAQQALGDSGHLLEASVAEAREALEQATQTRPVKLTVVADALVNTSSFTHLFKYWGDYLPFKQTAINERELAKWFVLREFARRPMRRASLETLGLIEVRFPGIQFSAAPPAQWRAWAGEDAAETWKDLLKLLVDFYIRSNSAISVEAEFFRWVGTTIRPKHVIGPGGRSLRNKRVSWPRMGTRARLAALIVKAFNLDWTDRQTQERVNDVLQAAWHRIRPALKQLQDGYQLDIHDMLLAPITESWLCPLTRTLLDTTLRGHTPYQPPLGSTFGTQCRPIRIPRPPHLFPGETERDELKDWLEANPELAEARAAGALPEFTERVLSFSDYFQVAEHSAQLQSTALQKSERQFRSGRLNLLSCSTTMEMGVDIGNLSGIAMNNAPPSPANFLQRVGRAGRRGESAAVSLTVCRSLPHDQAVFAQPDWPFVTPIHITPVKLDSEPIVARHVRAALLTAFLAANATGSAAYKLQCGWFFNLHDDQDQSVCDRFVAWLEGDADDSRTLRTHLRRIIRATALEGLHPSALLADAVQPVLDVADRFGELRQAIDAQLMALPEEDRESSPAAISLLRQLARLDQEYLLSFLADEQLLPGYGFPTGVLPLVTTTIEEIRALKSAFEQAKEDRKAGKGESPEDRKERIDARSRLMGFPTRDLPIALREYAPGNKVVLERRTYESRGVTLNWHLPPQADQSDYSAVQALRKAWRCRKCGAAGTHQLNAPSHCPSCRESQLDVRRYLQPAGFAVDLFTEASMDTTAAPYIAVEDPWVSSGEGPFESLGRPALVRFRHSSSGEIIHINGGLHRLGYALCLRCGRAEPESDPAEDGAYAELPKPMQDHWRLRGGKGSQWRERSTELKCEGNDSPYAIQRYFHLGGTLRTDVLEIHVVDPGTGNLVTDHNLMTTLAVAVRKVAARTLGIDERELGYQVVRRIHDGHRGWAFVLFDTAAGGAGFCANLPPLLPELLRQASEACRCPNDCDQACHACLLTHDTQHDLDRIFRKLIVPDDGTTPFIDQHFLQALALPDDLRVFGEDTTLVWGSPAQHLLRVVRTQAGEDKPILVRLFLAGPLSDWDPIRWTGRRLVRALSNLERVSVQLALPYDAPAGLDWQQARQLAGLAEIEGLMLVRANAPIEGQWAEVVVDQQAEGFATDSDSRCLDDSWCTRLRDAMHVRGPMASPSPTSDVLDAASIASQPSAGTTAVDLRPCIAGPAHAFGARFWSHLSEAAPGLATLLANAGPLDRITYQDRYLRSPLAVHGLYVCLARLQTLGVLATNTQVDVITLESTNMRHSTELRHDFRDSDVQREVTESLLGQLPSGLSVTLVPENQRSRTEHHRSLELAWGATEVEIRLDQGFGFIYAKGNRRYPHDRAVGAQVTRLLGGSWQLEGQYGKTEAVGYVIQSRGT